MSLDIKMSPSVQFTHRKGLLPMKWRTFLNTPDEWHAFWIGCFETLIPLPARVKFLTWNGHTLQNEYVYYSFGRGVGFAPWAVLVITLLAMVMK